MTTASSPPPSGSGPVAAASFSASAASASAVQVSSSKTVLFTDIVGSTTRAAALGDRGWQMLLQSQRSVVRKQFASFGGREIDTAGDGFLATFEGPAGAIRAAIATVDALAEIGIDVRIGLHTGEVEVRGEDVSGIGVHIGAGSGPSPPRARSLSQTVKDLVAGWGIDFAEHGSHQLKGVPGRWNLFPRQANPGG